MGTNAPAPYDAAGAAPGKIFTALAAVKDEINKIGVAKERENKQQGFQYRGIDDALNSFSGPFARNKVLTAPVFKTNYRGDLKTRNSTVTHVVVECVCTFLSLEDGSSITVGPFEGEATDSLDKATTKATSVALRNLLFMTFTVPFGAEEPEQYEGDAERGVEDTRSPAGGPRTIEGLSKSQLVMLDRRLAARNLTKDVLLDEFGGVNATNFRAAIEWIDRS